MLVSKLNGSHFGEIAKLEEKIYPAEFRLGEEDFLHDYFKKRNYFAYGVFSNGELIGYMAGHYADKPEHIFKKSTNPYYDSEKSYYISDLACLNPFALRKLLIYAFHSEFFYKDNTKIAISCECRYTSYKLLKNMEKKGLISIIREVKYEEYYGEEDMIELSFSLDSGKINNKKDKLYYYLTKQHNQSLSTIIQNLKRDFSLEYVIEQKKFILKTLNELNVEYCKLLGDTLNFRRTFTINSKNKEKAMETFIKNGYVTFNSQNIQHPLFNNGEEIYKYRDANNYYHMENKAYSTLSYSSCMQIFKNIPIKIKYTDTVSDYRCQIVNKLNFLFKDGVNNGVICLYDKFGNQVDEFRKGEYSHNKIVKYYFSNIFDYAINMFKFEKNIEELIKEYGIKNSHYSSSYSIAPSLLKIRRVVGEEVAYEVFNKKIKVFSEKDNSLIHDYLYLALEIISPLNLKYLTKGAIKKLLLDYSFHNMRKISTSLNNFMGQATKIYKDLDVKEIRKTLSKFIRKSQVLEATDYLNKVIDDINKITDCKIGSSILPKHIDKIRPFLDRMNKYMTSGNLSISSLVSIFGKEMTKNVILGKYEGLFTPKDFCLNQLLANELKIILSSNKSKKYRRLYGNLNKIKPVSEILNGNINFDEINEIYNLLKHLNIDINDNIEISKRLYAKIEPKCSPEFLMAGNASVCCMSFGRSNAITYAKEKGFGVINVYYNDRVIANSVIWINDIYNSLVIDNMEVAPNYKKTDILSGIEDLYKNSLLPYILKEYNLDFAFQGENYNDLILSDYKNSIDFTVKARDVSVNSFYTDARRGMPIELQSIGLYYNKIKTIIKDKNQICCNSSEEDFINELVDIAN